MAQLTVRNVAADLVRALRVRAAQKGRSAESEHRSILGEVLGNQAADFWIRADEFRKTLRKQRTDSAELLRQMRDER